MSTIIISPFSRKLPSGTRNPKDYPWWPELVQLLTSRGVTSMQIGVEGEPSIGASFRLNQVPLKKLAGLVEPATTWLSVDNFLPHFMAIMGAKKPGAVIFSRSSPTIFGYPWNVNLLKAGISPRANQFASWTETPYDENAFMKPEEVMLKIAHLLEGKPNG